MTTGTSETYRRIRDAVRARRQITFVYDRYYREACPTILGYKEDGQEAVLAYQFGGKSRSNLPSGGQWRCFDLARITELHVRDGEWYGGKSHTRTQPFIRKVDVDVNIPDTLIGPEPLPVGSPKLRPPRRSDE
jgi:predicted DNA-binding transcriptional regulator YafY